MNYIGPHKTQTNCVSLLLHVLPEPSPSLPSPPSPAHPPQIRRKLVIVGDGACPASPPAPPHPRRCLWKDLASLLIRVGQVSTRICQSSSPAQPPLSPLFARNQVSTAPRSIQASPTMPSCVRQLCGRDQARRKARPAGTMGYCVCCRFPLCN